MDKPTRRDFLKTTILAAFAAATPLDFVAQAAAGIPEPYPKGTLLVRSTPEFTETSNRDRWIAMGQVIQKSESFIRLDLTSLPHWTLFCDKEMSISSLEWRIVT